MVYGINGGPFESAKQKYPEWYTPPSLWINGSAPTLSSYEYTYSHLIGKYIYYHHYQTMYKYDINANIHTTLGNIGEDSYRATSSLVNTSIYIFSSDGRYEDSYGYKRVVCYDTNTHLYSTVADMDEYRRGATSTVYGDNIYLMGGYKTNSWSNNFFVETPQCFNITTRTWTSLPAPGTYMGVEGPSSATIGHEVFYWGGKYLFGGSDKYVADMCVYNTQNGTWSVRKDQGQQIAYASTRAHKEFIYSFGGDKKQYYGRRYQVTNGLWDNACNASQPSVSLKDRLRVGFEIVDDFFYVFGGNQHILEIFVP